MDNTYKEAARIRGLIRDARGLEITSSGPRAFVKVPAQSPDKTYKILGQGSIGGAELCVDMADRALLLWPATSGSPKSPWMPAIY